MKAKPLELFSKSLLQRAPIHTNQIIASIDQSKLRPSSFTSEIGQSKR